jgi:nucleoside-diphosphate-sugar epimerase
VRDAVNAVVLAATDGRAAGEIYLVTDGMAYSTRWMYEQIRLALGRTIPCWAVPLWCWRGAAQVGSALQRLSGKALPLTTEAFSKLADDAWFSSRKIREELRFDSTYRLDTELPKIVQAYVDEAKRPATARRAR